MNSPTSEQYLSISLAYLEVGKCASASNSEQINTAEYQNAVAYQAFHAIELFFKYMIHRKEGSVPHIHKLSELEKKYQSLYPCQSYSLDHPFDFSSYQVCDLNEGEQELVEKHKEKFKPDFMDQHLRYPTDYRTGGYSFAFDAEFFDDLRMRMLSISGVSC